MTSLRAGWLCCVVGAALAVLPWAAAPGTGEVPQARLDEARKATAELLAQTRAELVRAIESSGPLRGIVVCKYSVPEIASTVSRKYGARVTRVSLKPRNPALGGADAWEQSALLAFEQRIARGEKAEAMEFAEVVSEPAGRYFRYARAMPLLPVCTHCHGPADRISDAIKAQIGSDYPYDEATGTEVGQLRGAVTFKKRL